MLVEDELERHGIRHSTEQTRVIRKHYWMLLRRNMTPLSHRVDESWGNFTVKRNLPQLCLFYEMSPTPVNTDSSQLPVKIAAPS